MSLTNEDIREKSERAINDQTKRIHRARARIAHAVETGVCTPEQAEHSERVTIGRMVARLDFLEREHEKWEARHPLGEVED
jgi:hypothetical protein